MCVHVHTHVRAHTHAQRHVPSSPSLLGTPGLQETRPTAGVRLRTCQGTCQALSRALLGPPGCGRRPAHPFPPPGSFNPWAACSDPAFALGCESFPRQAHRRAHTHTLAQQRKRRLFLDPWASSPGTDASGVSSVPPALPRVSLAPQTAPSCGPALPPRLSPRPQPTTQAPSGQLLCTGSNLPTPSSTVSAAQEAAPTEHPMPSPWRERVAPGGRRCPVQPRALQQGLRPRRGQLG